MPRKSASQKSIIAYHGSSVPIRRFDRKFSTQGVFWFSEDKEKILQGESGAESVAYLIKVRLRVNKTAGWTEYDKYSLDELHNLGYDSVHLDDDWVIFDEKRITIVDTQHQTPKIKTPAQLDREIAEWFRR